MIAIEATRMDQVSAMQLVDTRNQAERQDLTQKGTNSTRVEPVSPGKKSDRSVRVQVPEIAPGVREENSRQNTLEELGGALAQLNDFIEQHANRRLSFFVDDTTGKQGVRVIDTETEKVVKQIPPEEVLELAKRLKEQLGVLLDEVI